MRTKREKTQREQNGHNRRDFPMFRIAREGLALASVAGFVWMVCQVASFAG
jgi:hypothetical protein